MLSQSQSALTVVLSALFAGIVAPLSTFAVERLGGAVGGIIATAPTTIVPASIGFIYAARRDAEANIEYSGVIAALGVVPLGMLINALFLLTWRLVPPYLPKVSLRARLAMMVAFSLTIWAVSALLVTLLMRSVVGLGLRVVLVGVACVGISLCVGVYTCLRTNLTPAPTKRVPPYMYVLRGLFCATSIGVSVLIKQSGGEIMAGMISVFPAIFLTTMAALWLSHDDAVPCGAVGPMMLGSSAVSAYALFGSQIFPLAPFQSAVGLGE